MQKKSSGVVSAAMSGMLLGAVAGIAVNKAMTPKKKTLTKNAGRALNAVGAVMQTMSSMMK